MQRAKKKKKEEEGNFTENYLWVGDVVAGLDTPGDLRIALLLPSDKDELEAAVNCLFSRQHSSSNFTSAIFFYTSSPKPKILVNKRINK